VNDYVEFTLNKPIRTVLERIASIVRTQANRMNEREFLGKRFKAKVISNLDALARTERLGRPDYPGEVTFEIPPVEPEVVLGGVIRFEVVPVDRDSVKVSAWYDERAIELNYLVLLDEIRKEWPDVEPQLRHVFGEELIEEELDVQAEKGPRLTVSEKDVSPTPLSDLTTSDSTANGESVQHLDIDPVNQGWERALPSKEIMRKHYKDYSPRTARDIIEAIPKAWEACDYDCRWGPGHISRFCAVGATTLGRYLNAFKAVGIKTIAGIDLP